MDTSTWYSNWQNNDDITPELKAEARLLGYRRLPPRIDQFLADPKYLGNTEMSAKNLYPAWGEYLFKIFPTRLQLAHNIVALHCALGTGKTYFTTICELYTECRFDHLDNQKYLRDSSAKEMVSSLNHISTDKAFSDYLDPIHKIKSQSPYFRNNMVSHNRLAHKMGGERNLKRTIGGDAMFYAFSELEFWNYHKAKYALESAIGRINSRFIHAKDHWGLIVIDSSPSDTATSVVNDFLAKFPDTLNVEMSAWKAKAHKNIFFKLGEFWVYTGDQSSDPFILDYPPEELPEEYDKDNLLRVPEELRKEFTLNLPRALKDQAGITKSGFGGKFFKDTKKLKEVFTIPQYNKDILTPNFYDNEDRLYDYLFESITRYPEDKKIFGRVDLGLSNDLAGIAFGYFDKYIYPFPNNPKYKVPTYVVPTVAYIGRLPGQVTSIDKITELALAIHKERELGGFSTDNFQSDVILQRLKLEKIESVKKISVDRNNLAYNYLKNTIYSGNIKIANSTRLFKELSSLNDVNGKIDHIQVKESTADTDGSYSKDGADAVSGLVYHMYIELDKADKISNKYSATTSKNIIHGYGDRLPNKHADIKAKVTTQIIKNVF